MAYQFDFMPVVEKTLYAGSLKVTPVRLPPSLRAKAAMRA